MTNDYSFLQLSVPESLYRDSSVAKFSVRNSACCTNLDYREIPPSEYHAPLTLTGPTSGSIAFSALDRGC